MTDKYIDAVKAIIKEQEKIIGKNISEQIMRSVPELRLVDGEPKISGDPKHTLSVLVEKYAILFGKASIEVSKEALVKVGKNGGLNFSELPDNLR